MGDINDMYNVQCVVPGNGTRKRVRYDLDDNLYAKDIYVRPLGLIYPRYDLAQLSGANNNIKAFGAVGDGVTDDTAAFTAALALGIMINVPKGQYLTTAPLTFISGSGLIGELGATGILSSSNAAGAIMTLVDYGYIINCAFGYRGTNTTTNSWVSIAGSNIIIDGCRFGGNPLAATAPAFCLSFDTTGQYTYIENTLLKAASKCVRFTAAANRALLHGNVMFCVGAGTNCLDNTNSGALNEFVNNIWNHEGGVPTNHVVAAVAATFIGNRSTSSIAYTGAGLAASRILDTQSQSTGWDVTSVGADKTVAVDATTITATDPNIQDLAAVVNAIKAALISQGMTIA